MIFRFHNSIVSNAFFQLRKKTNLTTRPLIPKFHNFICSTTNQLRCYHCLRTNIHPSTLFFCQWQRYCHHSTKNAAATSKMKQKVMFEHTTSYSVNHFAQPNLSWNETINKARKISKYDMNLYQRMISDYMLNNFLDYSKIESNKSFQEFISHFFRTYNYQITGLVTILFTKLFLYSRHFWPDTFGINNKASNEALENDLIKLAECYDMISYGFYFHDTISNLDSCEKSLRNLIILLGDYFLVKSSYDVASLNRIDLYKIYVQTVEKCSQGESLSLTTNESETNNVKEFDDNPEVKNDFYLNNDQSQICQIQIPSNLSDDPKAVKKLINYCYLTGGHLVASSLQSSFYLVNFSQKAQSFAFEFGRNIGMALRISNQLSALFVYKLTNGDIDVFNVQNHRSPLPVNHLNLSYFAKFPLISIETMQYLLGEYLNRSILMLSSLCEAHSFDENLKLPENYLVSEYTQDSSKRLSDQSKILMETLFHVINEIQCFNQKNILVAKQSTK